ncbi:MAG: 23S rRNA (adenine(2030)-N(6))-methyltransferase RlmJ [Alphaproteobacteria bacterium]|nr:23S rRNA (adenine(2030)-N(6))-methyltransferase RlmJ [Alphaproteobacteria bacterium]
MNYRHVYHAGNFADVLKHLVLTLVITYLKRKPTPFRVIDTHAGAGLYHLGCIEAEKTGEWRSGIGRVLSAELPGDAAAVLAPYLDIIRGIDEDFGGTGPGEKRRGELLHYPGSPLIAARLLRAQDFLIANELHPDDCRALQHALGRFGNTKVMGIDGYVALKAVLPPKERRGVVLIDPPFEEPGELGRLLAGLREGVKRFQTGTFVMWHPIKDPRAISGFKRELAGLGLGKLMAVEFHVQAPDDVERLNGHGLVILNPPFTLGDDLKRVLPALVSILGAGDGAGFEITAL